MYCRSRQHDTPWFAGIAITQSSTFSGGCGVVVDARGGLHRFYWGTQSFPGFPSTTAYWSGHNIVRGVTLTPGSTCPNMQGYVLDGFGNFHPFGGLALPTTSAFWHGWDIARGIVATGAKARYVVDGWGNIHPFGTATHVTPSDTTPGHDTFVAIGGRGLSG